jgi:hypothetical protein
MPPLPPLNLDPIPAPRLENPTADAFAVVNRNVLGVLRLVCEAEAVTVPEDINPNDPAALRREVFFSLQKLGFIEKSEPHNERELLEVLRESLPLEAESLAVIFALRACCQSCPFAAQQEVTEAMRWATRAVLSPL